MTRPATAGPTSRAPLKIVEFRLTALASRSGPTISETNDCRTGASIGRDRAQPGGQHEHVPEGDGAGGHQEPEHAAPARPSAPG